MCDNFLTQQTAPTALDQLEMSVHLVRPVHSDGDVIGMVNFHQWHTHLARQIRRCLRGGNTLDPHAFIHFERQLPDKYLCRRTRAQPQRHAVFDILQRRRGRAQFLGMFDH